MDHELEHYLLNDVIKDKPIVPEPVLVKQEPLDEYQPITGSGCPGDLDIDIDVKVEDDDQSEFITPIIETIYEIEEEEIVYEEEPNLLSGDHKLDSITAIDVSSVFKAEPESDNDEETASIPKIKSEKLDSDDLTNNLHQIDVKREITDEFDPIVDVKSEITDHFNPLTAAICEVKEEINPVVDVKSEVTDDSDTGEKSYDEFDPPAILGSICMIKEYKDPYFMKSKPIKTAEGRVVWPDVNGVKPKILNVQPTSIRGRKKPRIIVPQPESLTVIQPTVPASFAGIAVPQNIVPCLSPEPTDKRKDIPQFFNSSMGLTGGSVQMGGRIYKHVLNIHDVHQHNQDTSNVNNDPNAELEFIRKYQQSRRRESKNQMYKNRRNEQTKQKLLEVNSTNNTVSVNANDCIVEPVTVKINAPIGKIDTPSKTTLITNAINSGRWRKRKRSSKYDTMIRKMNSGGIVKNDDLNGSAERLVIEGEINAIKTRLALSGSSVRSCDSADSSGNSLNEQVPIVIEPSDCKDKSPVSKAPFILPKPDNNKIKSILYIPSTSNNQPSSVASSNQATTVASIIPRRSRYDKLTRDLKSKTLENFKLFQELNVKFQPPSNVVSDVMSDLKEASEKQVNDKELQSKDIEADESESEGKDDDNDPDSDDPRFKDDQYLANFIKSFQNNPRRYKVYPQASKYRKALRRYKKVSEDDAFTDDSE